MKELMNKLFLVQSTLPVIPKTSTNPHFKSKYADLPTIMELLKPLLQIHKVLLMQPIHESELPNVLRIGTVFVDAETGEKIEQITTVPIGANLTPQAFGSAVTYARRYALCAMLGIVADEDDDGNASSVVTVNQTKNAISKQQLIALVELAKSKGMSKDDLLAVLKPKGVYRLDTLTPELYEKFMTWVGNQSAKEGA